MTPRLEPLVVDLDSVEPHPENPRSGDIGAIVESLSAHGQYAPLVVQRSTRRILVGNHRWRAMKELGWTEVSVLFLDVDDEEALRILLVDNRTSDVAGYDQTALAELLSGIAEVDPDLFGTGWSPEELDRLLDDMSEDLAVRLAQSRGLDRPMETEGFSRVTFRFGDYSGTVARSIYDRFVSFFDETRGQGAELLEDVLDVLLTSKEST